MFMSAGFQALMRAAARPSQLKFSSFSWRKVDLVGIVLSKSSASASNCSLVIRAHDTETIGLLFPFSIFIYHLLRYILLVANRRSATGFAIRAAASAHP